LVGGESGVSRSGIRWIRSRIKVLEEMDQSDFLWRDSSILERRGWGAVVWNVVSFVKNGVPGRF